MAPKAKTEEKKTSMPPRATFKRAEVYQMGQMIEAVITKVGGGLIDYMENHSDATVAAEATILLSRAVTVANIANVRKTCQIGRLANEGRTTSEQVQALLDRIAKLAASHVALTKRMDAQDQRIAELEKVITEPGDNDSEQPPVHTSFERTGGGNGRHR